MTKFCVIRHPEAGLGTAPDTALDHYLGRGWERVSAWSGSPSDFVLADYTEAEPIEDEPLLVVLDEAPTKKTKKTSDPEEGS